MYCGESRMYELNDTGTLCRVFTMQGDGELFSLNRSQASLGMTVRVIPRLTTSLGPEATTTAPLRAKAQVLGFYLLSSALCPLR